VCFFASFAAEMDTRPGPVRDLAVRSTEEWFQLIETAVRDAQAEGSIDPSEDPSLLAFELEAYLLLANAQFVASRRPAPIEQSRRALDRKLESVSV
jgi:Tetracyclin repressor-like, C-terminal domain